MPAVRKFVLRHALLVRITHWINVVCTVVLVMSGLQIFNAHPALYWGIRSDFDRPVFAIAGRSDDAPLNRSGSIAVFGHRFVATGLFGESDGTAVHLTGVGLPSWSTLPGTRDLAGGRRWHFFFAWLFVANGLIYLAHTIISRHLQKDLIPTGREMRTSTTRNHLRVRGAAGAEASCAAGAEASSYNVLQKLSYLAVIFVPLPLLIFSGLAMSPAVEAAFPELETVFRGRQSARTVHFIAAFFLVAFIVLHVAMLVFSGPWNKLRAMVTGRYAIKYEQP